MALNILARKPPMVTVGSINFGIPKGKVGRGAFGIEGVYGFFHYTTFYNLLINKEASLLIPDASLVALCMTIIISGLSISALIQSRKQAKDDDNL